MLAPASRPAYDQECAANCGRPAAGAANAEKPRNRGGLVGQHQQGQTDR